MINYRLPELGSAIEIGRRAKHLRILLGLTIDQVADAAEVGPTDVTAMEAGKTIALANALAIHKVLSIEDVGELLFTRPRLRNLDEVEAFERRRLAKR